MPHGKCGAGADPVTNGAGAELGFQLLYRLRILLGQAGIELFGALKLGTCEARIALAGVELGLNVMSLRAGGMISQHLVHHLLGLIEMTLARGLVDLIDGRIPRRQCRRAGQGKRESRSRQRTRKQCSHNHPAMAGIRPNGVLDGAGVGEVQRRPDA